MSGVEIFLAAICVNATFCENYPPTVEQEETFYSSDLAVPSAFGKVKNMPSYCNNLDCVLY